MSFMLNFMKLSTFQTNLGNPWIIVHFVWASRKRCVSIKIGSWQYSLERKLLNFYHAERGTLGFEKRRRLVSSFFWSKALFPFLYTMHIAQTLERIHEKITIAVWSFKRVGDVRTGCQMLCWHISPCWPIPDQTTHIFTLLPQQK